MKQKHSIIVAGLTAALGANAGQAANFFVFGDSLVDTGNADAALRATGQATRTPASSGYFMNRFSNGYNFADVVSSGLGKGPSLAFGYPPTLPHSPTVTPGTYFYGGNNFSYGGAQTREVADDASPSFQDQLGLFAASGKTIAADDIVLVTFGGNDIQQELLKKAADPTYTPDFTQTDLALRAGLNALVAAGARNILVTGEADVGRIPRITELGSPSLNALGTQLSFNLNNDFRSITTDVDSLTGFNLQFFDLFALNNAILQNPSAYGFTNVTQPCLNETTGVLANPTCAGYLYFDRIHPTALGHQIIGNRILDQLNGVPEPSTWVTMILGFGLVGAAVRRRLTGAKVAA